MTSISPPDITVFHIADWFLAKAKSENKPLKHMKLQKLVYFAYGWHYAYTDMPLFGEKIYAWRHGPVVKDLYERFKPFKGNPITGDVNCQSVNEFVESVLEGVWVAYEHYPDTHLSKITHRPDSPWTQAYRSYEWDAEIAPESIRDYFKERLRKYDHA